MRLMKRLTLLMFVATLSLSTVGAGIAFADDDADGDGLSDIEEANHGTNPAIPDTDGDGLSDGDEVNIHSTLPLVPDTDGGGIDDGDEIINGTDPLNGDDDDADGDGVSLADGDCDDTDPLINPDALEVIDAVDNDCDGEADNALRSTVLAEVPGRGIATAPGLQKVFNPKSQAASHAGGSQAPGRSNKP